MRKGRLFHCSGALQAIFLKLCSPDYRPDHESGLDLVVTLNKDFERFDEVISFLAFIPLVAAKRMSSFSQDDPVDSLKSGVSYLIDPQGLFTAAVFFNGIGLQEFSVGETNLLEATDNAFFLEAGLVSTNARNGTTI